VSSRYALRAYAPSLVDALCGLLRPPCEVFKDGALLVGERLAHGGDKQDPPRRPAFSSEDPTEQVRIAQSGSY